MLGKLVFCIAAFLAVSRATSNTMAQEWRDDLCDRADIPYDRFTDSVRLNPDDPANFTARTRGRPRFRVREKVLVKPGEEDTILLDFDIKLSADFLQDTVSIEKDHNDVALIIDGTKVDGRTERECIVATTSVYLPKSVNHLVFDLDNSGIDFTDIKSKFEKLEVRSWNGGVHIKNSVIRIDDFRARLGNGPLSTYLSTIVTKVAAVRSGNGHIGARFSGAPIESLEASTGNGGVEIIVVDEDSAATDVTSKIKASSGQGHVLVKSHIRGKLELQGKSGSGSASGEVYGNIGGSFHAQSRVGHVEVHGPVKIRREQKTITGNLIEGIYGEEEESSIFLDSSVGSVRFFVDPSKHDARTGTEPSPFDDTMQPGDRMSRRVQSSRHALPWLFGITVILATVWFVSSRYGRSVGSRLQGNGQIKI